VLYALERKVMFRIRKEEKELDYHVISKEESFIESLTVSYANLESIQRAFMVVCLKMTLEVYY
jgi:hypothetical protein